MDESGTEGNRRKTNKEQLHGDLKAAMKGRDIFVGVSAPNIVTAEMVSTMADDAIVFAMANPTPEIMPDEARKGGARVIATGRSDFRIRSTMYLYSLGCVQRCV